MRRAPFLVPLSREHHDSLKLAHHIKAQRPGTALTASLQQELERQRELLPHHFAEEEKLLLPLLDSSGHLHDSALADRLLAEHTALRQALEEAQQPENLLRLAQMLEAHIRFEERELFPAAETLAADGQPGTARK